MHILKPQSYARKLQKSQLGPYHGNSSMANKLTKGKNQRVPQNLDNP